MGPGILAQNVARIGKAAECTPLRYRGLDRPSPCNPPNSLPDTHTHPQAQNRALDKRRFSPLVMAFLGNFFRAAMGGDSADSTGSDAGSSASAAKPKSRPKPGRRGGRSAGGKVRAALDEVVVVTQPSAALNRMVHGFPFADAEIVVGKDAVRFPVHSAIVATVSPVLKTHFYGSGSELQATTMSVRATPELVDGNTWWFCCCTLLRIAVVVRALAFAHGCAFAVACRGS